MALPKTEEKIMMIYTCKYCRKYYKRRHAAEWHQHHCPKNPRNAHPCFNDCLYLQYEKKEIEQDECGYGGSVVSPATFYCKKHNKYMYSYIAERIKLVSQYHEDIGERMPVECLDYTHEADSVLF